MATSSNVQLWIRFGREYHLALSIPVADCLRFSYHPLTWLRFLGYAIYGKEGYIALEREGSEVADYRPGAPISPGDYYYISQGESYSSASGPVAYSVMKDADFRLLDPKVMDDRTSTTSNLTSRRASFKQDLNARDGCCVMTGTKESTACHIIPHAKGDQVRPESLLYCLIPHFRQST
jgi:hypothetical protein